MPSWEQVVLGNRDFRLMGSNGRYVLVADYQTNATPQTRTAKIFDSLTETIVWAGKDIDCHNAAPGILANGNIGIFRTSGEVNQNVPIDTGVPWQNIGAEPAPPAVEDWQEDIKAIRAAVETIAESGLV